MSEWITDRLPTKEDAPYGHVLVSGQYTVCESEIEDIVPGEPWMPMPAPYVKPKRWTVEWDTKLVTWSLYDRCRDHRLDFLLAGLKIDQGDVAQRIEDFFNEVMP